MPYLFTTAVETSRSGIPTMRSMALEFTQDRNCQYLDKQYMLGGSLLVAPVFNDEGRGIFYLPQGTWTDFFTGEETTGGVWVEKEYDYLRLPLMVKENSIIATGRDDRPDYDYAADAEIRIYCLKEGAETSGVIYNGKGESDLKISARKQNGEILLQATASKPYIVRLVNVTGVVASGASVRPDGNDTILIPDGGNSIVIRPE